MRRRCIAFSGLLLLGALFPCSAGISIAIGERSGSPGQTLMVPIDVRSDQSLTAMQLDIVFPHELVELLDVSQGDWSSDHILMSSAIGDGTRRILVYSPTNMPLPDSVLANAEIRLGDEFPDDLDALSLGGLRFVEETGEVLEIALSPFVRLTSPAGGDVLEERTPLSLSSIALETSGSVTRVEFYVNGRQIAMDSSAPYNVAWQLDGNGDVMLYAVAYDEDGDLMTSPAVELQSTGWSFIQSWREANFTAQQLEDPGVNGLFADPEGDSIVNFLEFAFGMDPWVNDRDQAPFIQLEESGGTSFLSLQYRRLVDSGPLNYIIEMSDDLSTWTPVDSAVSETVLEESGGVQTLLLEQIAPLTGTSSPDPNYLRVRLEVNE